MIKELFGKKLKELRDAFPHTQKELGEILKVGPKQIQRYETGLIPEHENIQTLIDIYSYDFTSLIYDVSRATSGNEKSTVPEKYMKTLEEQVSFLRGQLRDLLVITQAKVQTNQSAIGDLLVKQKIGTVDEIEDRLSRDNVRNYQKLKSEFHIS